MDPEAYRAIVFNSARDGNLRRLRIFLEDRSHEWLHHCLSSQKSQTPPLVIAARNGHFDVVKYLLEKGADVSITGTVSFDGEIIPGAPVLWAAAAAGHIDIVRYLVEKAGADINQTTQSNSSPLRGACYDGHFDIVQYLVKKGADIELANRHGHTPLMIAAFKMRADIVQFLLEQGADPCRASIKGNTAMHDAAEAGSNEIVCMLLEAGAKNVKDDCSMTPMQCAALAGHEEVLKSLSAVATAHETRDALKLFGATLVDKKMDLSSAVRVWFEAVNYGEPLRVRTALHVYDDLFEIDTDADIRHIIGDPDAIRMQALIMRERIIGGGHHETHYFIRYRGAVYCDLGETNRCFQLWMHALHLQQRHLCALHPSTISTIGAFIDTFILTVNEGIIIANADGVRVAPLSRKYVMEVLEKTVYELERFSGGDTRIKTDEITEEPDDENRCTDFLMLASLQLILLIRRLSPGESKLTSNLETEADEKENFDTSLSYMVTRLTLVSKCLNLYPLHAACHDIDKPVTARFPCACVITMLIDSGIDVNTKNSLGNTALHTILLSSNPRQSVIKLLLQNGATLLARNNDDQTCLELISAKLPRATGQLRLGRYLTLMGLAANVVRRKIYEVEYKKIVPKDLFGFLDLH
ncbi:sex-determining protein fem-1 [Loa loa]|uniref:Sex-determining protein fem-1 n=1 Tax=Loa loa TaxID=7209 RepID=A0A1I7W183_LOALO|nr:sex-determining protein fem-1 [Loa loa]EFO20401.1 sex-determining protein fem-1 [Loa loa]